MRIDFHPPIQQIPAAQRSVGLKCYAAGYKRALSLKLSGRALAEAVEEVDKITAGLVGSAELCGPIDESAGRPGRASGSLLDLI